MDVWLICYDIACDKRRLRAARWLLRFGMRVQESVFEIHSKSPAHFDRLWRGAEKVLDASSDSLRAYPITQQALTGVRVFGLGEKTRSADYALVL